MLKNKAYKFRLYPNAEQALYFSKCFGSVRFVYNNLLANRKEVYENGEIKKLTYTDLKRQYEWLYEIDSLALANSAMQLDTAYRNFFRGKGEIGFPKFKSKHKDKNTYTTNNQNGNIRIENKKIKLPKIGFVKVVQHREIPKTHIIKSCTISKTPTNKYYISILTEYTEEENACVELKTAIGLDYSSPHFFVDSQGNKGNYPKFFSKYQVRLAKEQRKLSKKQKGSNNYEKQKLRVAIVYEKIKNSRKDWIEKTSNRIAKTFDIACIEDLNMRAMSRGLCLGKATMDNGWGMFVNSLSQKAKMLVKVDKWYPSSKTCSVCGEKKKDLTLKDRKWTCPKCGTMHDRDVNASRNILFEGLKKIPQELREFTLAEYPTVDERYTSNLKSSDTLKQEAFDFRRW